MTQPIQDWRSHCAGRRTSSARIGLLASAAKLDPSELGFDRIVDSGIIAIPRVARSWKSGAATVVGEESVVGGSVWGNCHCGRMGRGTVYSVADMVVGSHRISRARRGREDAPALEAGTSARRGGVTLLHCGV